MKIIALSDEIGSFPKSIRRKIIQCPSLRFEFLKYRLPEMHFDYVVIPSKKSYEALKKKPKTKAWLFIGKKSFESSRPPSARVSILKNSSGEGIAEFFKGRRETSLKIFWPRSSIGRRDIPLLLRRWGHRVWVRNVYRPRGRKGCGAKFLKAVLKLQTVGDEPAVLVSSPSTFRVLQQQLGIRKLRSLKVRWIAIGKTTFACLKKWGIKASISPEASLQGMVKTALKGF